MFMTSSTKNLLPACHPTTARPAPGTHSARGVWRAAGSCCDGARSQICAAVPSGSGERDEPTVCIFPGIRAQSSPEASCVSPRPSLRPHPPPPHLSQAPKRHQRGDRGRHTHTGCGEPATIPELRPHPPRRACERRSPGTRSVIFDSATPWTAARKAPLSMGFFSGKNTGVGCYFLLQGIFLTWGSNPCLLHLLH